ncbi:MAG: hypothetical protein IIA88_02040, partial [Bacteroidetes bacterium]|nr:hypothetical protein [Bacteroidota bacterium]
MKKLLIIFIPLFSRIITGIFPEYSGPTIFNLESWAQSVRPAEEQHNFSWYTNENGLPQSQVYALLQDSKGYLWIGTYGGGLCRFDGTNFVTFTSKDGLGNDRIYSIMEDSKGNIWIGMDSGGLGKYKGSGSSGEEKDDDVKFINYTVKDGLNSNIILKIIEDHKGVLWLATAKGICTFDGKEFINFSKKNNLDESQVWAVMQDKNNNIWFGVKSGLFRYKYPDTLPDKSGQAVPHYLPAKGKAQTWQAGEAGKNIETFTTQQGLEHRFICSLLEDNKGSIWIGDYYTGLSYYNGKNFEHYSVADGLAGNMVLTIIEDKVGNIWFGSNGGVSKYERAGTSDFKSDVRFKNFREENGLSGNSVRSLLEDNEGNIWIGTSGSGLCKFSGDMFTHYYETGGIINHKVSSFTEDQDGNIWFATEGGLSKLSSSLTFTNYTTNEGLPVNVVTVLFKDKKDNIWIGTP